MMKKMIYALLLLCLSCLSVAQEKEAYDYLIHKPAKITEKTPILFLLHGYGADKEDLFWLKKHFNPNQIVIAVNAPFALDGGGWSWFQRSKKGKRRYDLELAKETLKSFKVFMQARIKELNNSGKQVYALGFSQGAIMIHSLLHSENPVLTGGVCLSGRLEREQFTEGVGLLELKNVPIFVSHGTVDDRIDIAEARAIKKHYEKVTKKLTYKEYSMGHSISPECLKDIALWVEKNIKF